MKKSMLIDNSKCIGCRACQAACKQWNQLPAEKTEFTGTYENPPRFSPITWTKIAFREYEQNGKLSWTFTKLGCVHCTDAACIKVCPANAISHTEYGTVVIDEKRCIGCNYCAANCTFNVIGFDQAANVARKCTFCYDRIAAGMIPACAKTCPTGAITYGDRSEIMALAERRLAEVKKNGHPNADIYGVEELDGLAMMYLLKDGKENAEVKYGLPEKPRIRTAAHIWDLVFKPVRAAVVLAMVFALWINKSESAKEKTS
ncbi:MAG TPA: 4Fe-4S dicluster domain-containing protein [Bacillota bacterium]|nr:4Fe-4S dicluster domain-containing protein [Bacillota bacterium]